MTRLLTVICQRVLLGLVTMFVVSIVIFSAVELLPGDAAEAILGQSATPETVAALRRELMLELPPHERYVAWVGHLMHGDLGRSLASNREIGELLKYRLMNTLFLAVFAAAISVPLSLTLGVLAALYRNSPFDRAINLVALSAISFPEFFIAYVLVLCFAVINPWFPPLAVLGPETTFGRRVYVSILPAVTLTFATSAHMMRMTRAAIVSLLASPYIEMARIKGVKPARVIIRHALPNAWGPISSVVALNLAYLIVGVVVVETVFVYPGLGQLLVDSVSKRDIPVVQAVSLFFAATYIGLNLAADVVGAVTNPRLLHPR